MFPLKSTRCNLLPQTLRVSVQQSRSRDYPRTPNFLSFYSKPQSPVHQWTPPRKLLIQMSGAPGSGKSTLANLLAHSLNCVVIDHGLIRSFFLSTSIPFSQSAQLSYSFQWVLASDILKQGRSVIVDSTCNYDETANQGMALAKQCGVEYKCVEFVELRMLSCRIRGRGVGFR
jgi:adenylylsulfate kinase-like enzyme